MSTIRTKIGLFVIALAALLAMLVSTSSLSGTTKASQLPMQAASITQQKSPLSDKAGPTEGCWSAYGFSGVSDNLNFLWRIEEIAPNDIWALGNQYTINNQWAIRLFHWDGNDWQLVPSPELIQDSDTFHPALEAISSNDIWVGTSASSSLIHWDGSIWSEVQAPEMGGVIDISGAATNDVWALGDNAALHWDGVQWSEVEIPLQSVYYTTTIEAIAADDVWIGAATGASPLRWHWNGTTWTSYAAPTHGVTRVIRDFAAVASNDVWAIGFEYVDTSNDTKTLIEHWNGTNWQIVPSPSYSVENKLYGASAASANDIWAVGSKGQETLVLHWDGSLWSVASTPLRSGILFSVAAISSSNIWAVGTSFSPSPNEPYAIRFTNPCLPPTSTPTPSSTATPTNTGTPTDTGTPTVTTTVVVVDHCWSAVAAPDPGPGEYDPALMDVNAVDANDIWAVGMHQNSATGSIALHWNGVQWSKVELPVLAYPYTLYAVDAISANDVWTVGAGGDGRATILHWDGSQWTQHTLTGSYFPVIYLNDVFAISTNDVWAIGLAYGEEYPTIHIVHWDGTRWSRNGGWDAYWTGDSFNVFATAANDVWAIGHTYDGYTHGVIQRWNGTSWTTINDPIVDAAGALTGIGGTSPSDMWVAGGSGLLHWNGTSWTNYSRHDITIVDIQAITANNVWAVGINGILHWDGTDWGRVENAPNQNSLYALAAIDADNLWAVGSSSDPNNHNMMLAHYSDECEPPRCPSERFTDVCSTDYFYQHVLDLNDLSIISGYNSSPPCGGPAYVPCFKPYNWSTRGQIAKVVSLSAGFNEPVTTQTFEDVPSAHTFYQYIERMASRGIISGYPCGGSGEPCSPDNLPYFRPGNMVGRGQLAKMAALAFGFNEPVTTETFEDVTPGYTFYPFIERLAVRDIIGGYECGNPEPCVPPDNRPYFRPGNNISRGQIAKIVNLARTQSTGTPVPTVILTSEPSYTPTFTTTPVSLPTDTPDLTETPTPTH